MKIRETFSNCNFKIFTLHAVKQITKINDKNHNKMHQESWDKEHVAKCFRIRLRPLTRRSRCITESFDTIKLEWNSKSHQLCRKTQQSVRAKKRERFCIIEGCLCQSCKKRVIQTGTFDITQLQLMKPGMVANVDHAAV